MDIKETVEELELQGLSNKEIIQEALVTLNNSMKYKQDGFKRIEKVSLLAINILIAELEKKDLEITALQMEHEHDVKMIDEVKGEAVKLYGEIEELKKDNNHQWEERCKLTFELENKDTIINTMQAEFERLEDLEDNTDMLKMELEKKDKIINFMAKRIKEDSEWFYSDLDNKSENEIKEYFKKKVEEDFNEGDKV